MSHARGRSCRSSPPSSRGRRASRQAQPAAPPRRVGAVGRSLPCSGRRAPGSREIGLPRPTTPLARIIQVTTPSRTLGLAMSIEAALDRLDLHVREVAREWAKPGVAVAVTDRERTLGVIAHGYADIGSGTPVTPGTLFQIGSISKSFAALA